jgi:hypothetical protein
MSKYDTNLASEFWVLSMLHRLGADASLTLGNKKSVDIVVVRKAGDAVTVDVKGVAGRWDWPADNIKQPERPKRHFLVFVSYEGRIDDPSATPSVWIVPYPQVERFTKQYRGRRNVSRRLLEDGGKRYRDAWRLLVRR